MAPGVRTSARAIFTNRARVKDGPRVRVRVRVRKMRRRRSEMRVGMRFVVGLKNGTWG